MQKTQAQKNNRRLIQRVQLVYYLKLYDQQTGEYFGSLVDIHTEGMKIVSESQITVRRNFKLRMNLPKGSLFGEMVDMHARSVWTKHDKKNEVFYTGFNFKDISPTAQLVIQNLVVDYKRSGLID